MCIWKELCGGVRLSWRMWHESPREQDVISIGQIDRVVVVTRAMYHCEDCDCKAESNTNM